MISFRKSCTIMILTIITTTIIAIPNLTRSSAQWEVEPTDSFDYVLDESTWSLEINDLEETGDGATYNTIDIRKASVFTVQVTAVDENWGVEYSIDNTTHSTTDAITNDQFEFEFLEFIYYPSYECERLITEGFGNSLREVGPELIHWFFIKPDNDTYNYLSNLTDINYHRNLPKTDPIEASFRAELVISDQSATFDLKFSGIITNESENTAIQFDHNMKFVWSDSTGNLLGYRQISTIVGSFKGVSLSEEISVICRLSDYDLDRFSFYAAFLPGYSFLITISGIISLLITALIIRKKRMKEIT